MDETEREHVRPKGQGASAGCQRECPQATFCSRSVALDPADMRAKQSPSRAQLDQESGDALVGLKRYDEALARYQSALKGEQEVIAHDPHDETARQDLGNTWYGIAGLYQEEHRKDLEIPAFRQTIAVRPGAGRIERSGRCGARCASRSRAGVGAIWLLILPDAKPKPAATGSRATRSWQKLSRSPAAQSRHPIRATCCDKAHKGMRPLVADSSGVADPQLPSSERFVRRHRPATAWNQSRSASMTNGGVASAPWCTSAL